MGKRIGIVVLLAGFAAWAPARAQEPPAPPLRLVVPNPPGGTVDIVARLIGKGMEAAHGRTTVVEDRPGGNTIIGTQLVAHAPADGNSLVLVSTSFAINAAARSLPYDPWRDFTPVARLVSLPYVVAVHPGVPVASLRELTAMAKSRNGALDYASFGTGQVTAEVLMQAAGMRMVFVPYQGGIQAVQAVVAGHVPVLIGPLSDALPYIASGKLRALAVTTAQRSDALPELPTVSESGYPQFDWGSWIGVLAPGATPPAVAARLSSELVATLQDAGTRAQLARLGVSVAPLGPAEFGAYLRMQARGYDAAIRQAGIKFD